MKFKEVQKSDYISNFWDEESRVLKTIWNTPIDMSEKVYREVIVSQIALTIKYAPNNVLVNTENAHYHILPETQKWINEKFEVMMTQVKLEKMAWIVSEDFFAQISFDQFIDDANHNDSFLIQYFTSEKDAFEWLLQKS